MKSPFCGKLMGGSGWEPGFLFGQAAKISHNVAFLCQLGLVALHKGGRLVLEGPATASSYATGPPAGAGRSKRSRRDFSCAPGVSISRQTHALQFCSLYRPFPISLGQDPSCSKSPAVIYLQENSQLGNFGWKCVLNLIPLSLRSSWR